MGVDQNENSEAVTELALIHFLKKRPILTFILMGLSFLLTGLISFNLIYLFNANLDFIREYGIMGLRDGGMRQLIGLVLSGYLALLLYLFFKVCEKVMVEWLLERRRKIKGD